MIAIVVAHAGRTNKKGDALRCRPFAVCPFFKSPSAASIAPQRGSKVNEKIIGWKGSATCVPAIPSEFVGTVDQDGSTMPAESG